MSINEDDPEQITEYLMSLDHDVGPPSEYTTDFLEMKDGVKLRHFSYQPTEPRARIIVLPGMQTLVMSWYKFLILLKKNNYHIDYIETREKTSSVIPQPYKNKFDEDVFISDFQECVQQLIDSTSGDFIVIGSSMGSNIIIKALSRNLIQPKYAVLVGPYADFHVPMLIRVIRPVITNFVYKKMLLPLLLKFTLKNVTNEDQDPFQAHKYKYGMILLDPIKFKHTIKGFVNSTIWNDLSSIDGNVTKCFLIGAGADPLHGSNITKDISKNIENSVFIDIGTNSAAHDLPMIEILNNIENYIK